jgi:hypothetical protein
VLAIVVLAIVVLAIAVLAIAVLAIAMIGNCSVGNTSGLITLRFVKTPLLPVGAGRHVIVDDHVFHRMLVQREMDAVVRVIQTTQSKRSVLVIDNDGALGQWIVGCKSAEEGVGRE